MNAILNLSPAIVSSASNKRTHVLPQEIFEQAKAAWKIASDRKELTRESIAAWAILRGVDPKKGFCAITNAIKLANGAEPWAAYESSMRATSRLTRSALAPWEKMLTQQGATFKGYQWSGSHPILAALAAERAMKSPMETL